MARWSPRTGTGDRTSCSVGESSLSHKRALATVGLNMGRHRGWEIRQAVTFRDQKGTSHRDVQDGDRGSRGDVGGFSGSQ